MKSLLKQLFFLLAPKPRLPADRAVILAYHSISDREDHFWAVPVREFKRQVAYIAAKKYPVVSLGELVRRLKAGELPGGAVAITFDDGHRDNLTVAFPLLARYNFPSTVFVETDCIGKTGDIEYMSAEELRNLPALVSVETHTKSHPKLAKLSAGAAREEIAGGKGILERLLGRRCVHLAYPFGSYNEQTVAVARGVGIEAAVTMHEGTVGPESGLLELPRVSVDRSTTRVQFRGKLSRAVDWYEHLKRV